MGFLEECRKTNGEGKSINQLLLKVKKGKLKTAAVATSLPRFCETTEATTTLDREFNGPYEILAAKSSPFKQSAQVNNNADDRGWGGRNYDGWRGRGYS